MVDSQPRRPSAVCIAQTIAAAVRQVPGVAEVSAPGVVAATYGVGTVVPGVAVHSVDGAIEVEVHIVAAYRPELRLPELGERVRQAMADSLAQLGFAQIGQLDVVIDDLAVRSPSR